MVWISRVLCRKVTILGAAGGIGQPLSLLLKTSQYISELFLHDVVNTRGVGVDLSHIDTKPKVKSGFGPEQLPEALKNAQLVLIPAGMPRKPGMLRSDLFKVNADIIRDLIKAVALNAPNAWIGIITNPVNITVPIAAGILKSSGVYNPAKLFGVTTLDCIRANTFVAEIKNLSPDQVKVPVVGGHSGDTIVPIFSSLRVEFSIEHLKMLTEQVRDAGTKVVEAKDGTGSATLSMAYAAARFAQSALRAMNGEWDVMECAFVESKVTSAPFFATPLVLGSAGVAKNLGLGELSEFEDKQIKNAVGKLISEYMTAQEYLKKNGFATS